MSDATGVIPRSFPPRKHASDDRPNETSCAPRVFAFQRVYTGDRALYETLFFSNGDTVLASRGYHVVCAPPGYDLCYLNVMAGPVRQWEIRNDPKHEWLLSRAPSGEEE